MERRRRVSSAGSGVSGWIALVLLASAAVGRVSIGADLEGDGEPVEYAILASNTYDGSLEFVGLERFPDMKLDPRLDAPGLEGAERLVISGADAWKAFWKRAEGELAAKASALPIDFDRETVLISAAGARSGPGSQTIIVDVLERADELVVQVEETDAACGGAGAPRHPLAAVRIARQAKPVRFDVQPLPCEGP